MGCIFHELPGSEGTAAQMKWDEERDKDLKAIENWKAFEF